MGHFRASITSRSDIENMTNARPFNEISVRGMHKAALAFNRHGDGAHPRPIENGIDLRAAAMPVGRAP